MTKFASTSEQFSYISGEADVPEQTVFGVVQMGPSFPGTHWVRMGSGDEKPGLQMYSRTESRMEGPSVITALPNSAGGGGHA